MKLREFARRISDRALVVSVARDAMLRAQLRRSRGAFARDWRRIETRTMIGPARLRGLYQAVAHVIEAGVPGEVVECGVARGGSAALMGLCLLGLGSPRELWLFDSFEGIPPATQEDPDLAIARLYTGEFRGALEDVKNWMSDLGIRNVRLVKGLFADTLPSAEVREIAVLHIDGDWYQSVRQCLDHLYDRVSPGGIIQVDDYGHWEGARRAVEEFRAHRRIEAPLRTLDYSGRQWIKS